MSDLATAGLSTILEDYLEAIFQLEQQGQVARVSDIARLLRVKMPSVTGAVKTLASRNLVEHEAYGYVTLTPAGRTLAEQVHQRHVAMVELLAEVMRLPAQQAEEEACRLEHALSPEALERLQALTQFIQHDDGIRERWLGHIDHLSLCEVAPEAELPEAALTQLSLADVRPGSAAVITRVCGEGPIRRRLLDMGLRPGAEVRVERVAPLGDPIEIVLMDYHLTLRRNEAAHIDVRVVEQPLAQTPPGTTVRIVNIRGGSGRRRRLAQQRLVAGAELTVLERIPGHGKMALRIGDADAAVGYSTAKDIIVRLLQPSED